MDCSWNTLPLPKWRFQSNVITREMILNILTSSYYSRRMPRIKFFTMQRKCWEWGFHFSQGKGHLTVLMVLMQQLWKQQLLTSIQLVGYLLQFCRQLTQITFALKLGGETQTSREFESSSLGYRGHRLLHKSMSTLSEIYLNYCHLSILFDHSGFSTSLYKFLQVLFCRGKSWYQLPSKDFPYRQTLILEMTDHMKKEWRTAMYTEFP